MLGNRIRAMYSDIYAIDTKIHSASADEIKGALSRVTGKDATTVNRYYTTFKTLAGIAKFGPIPSEPKEKDEKDEKDEKPDVDGGKDGGKIIPRPGFHYNIQIHLPATTDISVYNAIFKSLKDNLGI